MTAREFRAWAEWLIITLLVVAAIVVVVREPGRIIATINDPDPWSNISTILLSGGIGWIFGWRAQRDD
jgi:hypothetical protein